MRLFKIDDKVTKSLVSGVIAAFLGLFSTVIMILVVNIIFIAVANELLKFFAVVFLRLKRIEAVLAAVMFSVFENMTIIWFIMPLATFNFLLIMNVIFITLIHIGTMYLYSIAYESNDSYKRLYLLVIAILINLTYRGIMVLLFGLQTF